MLAELVLAYVELHLTFTLDWYSSYEGKKIIRLQTYAIIFMLSESLFC